MVSVTYRERAMYKVLITTSMYATGAGNTQVAVHTVVVEFDSAEQAKKAAANVNQTDSSRHMTQRALLLF